MLAGPADMGCSLGYHVKHDYHLPTMLASKDLEHVYEKVLKVKRASQANDLFNMCMCYVGTWLTECAVNRNV